MSKSTNLRLIFILVVCALIIGVSFVLQPKGVAYAMDYESTIDVSNDQNGYKYGNGSDFKTATTLQELFDDVAKADTTANIIINFKNVTTTDKVELDYDRRVVIQGTAHFSSGTGDSFLTLKSGDMTILGAFLSSTSSNVIRVGVGANLDFESGTLSIVGPVEQEYITATLINNGTTTISRGNVYFNSSKGGTIGSAIAQSGSSSTLTLTEEEVGSITISGKSAIDAMGGTIEINGGSITATDDDGGTNGSALVISNNANVTINGGTFSSVNQDKVISLTGGNQSNLYFDGGLVEGKIRFSRVQAQSGTKLHLSGRTVLPTPYGNVYLYSTDLNLTPDNARLGVNGADGYYVTGWGNILETNPSIHDFDLGAEISPKLSNIYQIELVVGEWQKMLSLPFGSSVNPNNYQITIPNGYDIVGWKNSSDSLVEAPFVVKGAEQYTAILDLSVPTIDNKSDLNKVYDGKSVSYTYGVEEALALNYVYLWQKKEGSTWVDLSISGDLSLLQVVDSGSYRLKVTVSDGVGQKIGYSNEFSVNITKATYDNIVHTPFTGVYDKDKRLVDYSLDSGFVWKDESIVPTVPQKEYSAEYCLDRDNYYAKDVTITIDLTKASAVASSHPAIANYFVYDESKTLKDYPFTNTKWRWIDESVVPNAGGAQNYYGAYYNPDRDNYFDYATEVALIISKANYVDVDDLHISVTYVAGLNSSVINSDYQALLGDYRVASTSMNLPLNQLKEFSLDAVYNANPVNYNDYLDAKILVTVTKGSDSSDYNANNTIDGGEYSPTKTLLDIALKSNDWRWENPSIVPTVNQTTYYLLYNPNPDLYYDYRLAVSVILQKSTLSGVTHPTLSGTYSQTQTLGSFILESGWSWVNPQEVPLVSKTSYSAVLDKGENYNLYYSDVTINLEKATIDMSGVSFMPKTVTYDGSAHNITYGGTLPDGVDFLRYEHTESHINAGVYECKAYFEQVDKINYHLIDGVLEAKLIINKATYDISSFVVNNVVTTYDGTAHYVVSEGQLPSGVEAVFHNNGKIDAGKHVVEVSFNQDDTQNYHLIAPLMVLLTINKALPSIDVVGSLTYAYDGKEHIPTATISNSEQKVAHRAESDEIKEIGEYSITFYANESQNYLYAEKVVTVIINPNSTTCGTHYAGDITSLVGKVVNNKTGIPSGATLTMDISSLSNQEVVFNILIDGKAVEGEHLVSILLPEGMFAPKVYAKVGAEYQEIASTISGNYIIFTTSALGEHKLVSADEKWSLLEEESMDWWAWLLISLAIAIVIGGVVVVVLLYKKGKISFDRVLTVFKTKQNEVKQSSAQESEGENREE